VDIAAWLAACKIAACRAMSSSFPTFVMRFAALFVVLGFCYFRVAANLLVYFACDVCVALLLMAFFAAGCETEVRINCIDRFLSFY
jgi:hypothetical protein